MVPVYLNVQQVFLLTIYQQADFFQLDTASAAQDSLLLTIHGLP